MNPLSKSTLLTLGLTLSIFGVRTIPSLAQEAPMCTESQIMCGGDSDAGITSSTPDSGLTSTDASPLDDYGGMTGEDGTSAMGDTSNVPNASVQPSSKTSTYSEADKCQDQADAWYLHCSDNLGADVVKGAAAGATAGFVMGGGPLAPPLSGAAAGAGAIVGGTGAAVGSAAYCLGGYALKSAECAAK
jgi:hypothetical protein